MAGAGCGSIGDGCGNVLDCGGCPAPQSCGAGGIANQCGVPPCTPRTCAQAGAACGAVGDGCGGVLQCGGCAAPAGCGGGGTPNQCGTPGCTPRTCAQAGATCGPVGDGCGGIIQCGTCTAPNICGGGGVPNVCGNAVSGGGSFAQCDAGVTTISGTVVAGTDPARGFGNPDPVVNAYVYVPSGQVQPITTGATCDQCASSQPAVVAAITGIDGTFVLTNPPVGNVTVVIQLGKWRRVINVNVNPCVDNPLTTAQTHLPRNRTEGNIPRFAVDTGDVDVLQCVLRKMGIEDSEFTNPNLVNGLPTSPGRVHFYQAQPSSKQGQGNNAAPGAGGAIINSSTPADSSLWGAQQTLNAYDIILFPCQGGRDDQAAAEQNRVINYANTGGRMFATHFSYTWLYNIAPFSGTAQWQVDQGSYSSTTGLIDTSFPKGQALSQWLQQVGASTTPGQIPVQVVRHDFNSVVAPSQRWMYSQAPDPAMPLHYTFNTPVGAPAPSQCGRVVYSDFHVENANTSRNVIFPAECSSTPMTPQEKLLEYMLFDLTSCVQPDVPTCTPKTCAQLGYSCGAQGDGCGGVINCGNCPAGQSCGGGGAPGVCGGGCLPRTCAQLGYSCGQQGDGCGGVLNCGTCPTGQSCGGGGTPGICGGGCLPKTCGQLGYSCGQQGDGCGGVINCGTCPTGQSCGGGGTPGVCGGGCVPVSCAQLGYNCGQQGDGCGGVLDCGTCTPPASCGGGGTPGVCGGGCAPRTCTQQGYNCGQQGDGCGNVISCGTCTPPQSCGGGGVAGVCGGGCTPRTCAQLGFNCGQQGDGCGGVVSCGTCPTGQSCGGGGVAGVCGGGCTPRTCAQLGYNCGQEGDGCGNVISCGTCTPPQSCGGGGVAGVCGGGCTPKTCAQQNIGCGPAGDGCGNVLNCGTCTPPQSCGGGGVAGQCGVSDLAVICPKLTCAQQNIACGPAGDGCGGLLQCGDCTPPQTCGGGGVSGQCGGGCTPRTCAQANANCGLVGDGCGGTIDCGSCSPPDTCGGGGAPNRCGIVG
jgi:hypothetical protein